MKQHANTETGMNAQQLHQQPATPFLVASRIFGKTLGAVYAASSQSAREIANTLWAHDRDALVIVDLSKLQVQH